MEIQLCYMMFCWSRHKGGCVMFRKNINMSPQTVGEALAWVRLTLHCAALLILAGHEFIDSASPKNFWWYSRGLLLLRWTPANWWSLAVCSRLNCLCWFVRGDCQVDWTAAKEEWNSPEQLFLNKSISPFALFIFLSTTSGGWWATREVDAFKNPY